MFKNQPIRGQSNKQDKSIARETRGHYKQLQKSSTSALETRARARVSTHPSRSTAHHARRARARYHARFLSCGTRAFVTLGGGHGETSSEHASLRSARGFFFTRRTESPPRDKRFFSSPAPRRGGAGAFTSRRFAPRREKARLRRARKRDRRSARKPGRAGFEPAAFRRGARRRRADPPSARRFGGAPRGRLSECPFCARNERVESGVSRASTGRARADVRGALRRARAETETGGGSGGGERNLRVRTESEGRESAPRARPAAAAAAAAYGPQTRAPGAQRLCVRP